MQILPRASGRSSSTGSTRSSSSAPSTEEQIHEITRLLLDRLARRLRAQQIEIEFTDEAVELLAHEGYDPEFGARPLRRTIQRLVENELSRMLLGGTGRARATAWSSTRSRASCTSTDGAGRGRRIEGGGAQPEAVGGLEMRSTVTLGVIVAPRLERDVPPELAEQLAEDLARRHPSVDWRTELVVDRLVEPPARVTDILEDARRRLLRSRWHLAHRRHRPAAPGQRQAGLAAREPDARRRSRVAAGPRAAARAPAAAARARRARRRAARAVGRGGGRRPARADREERGAA